MTTKFIGLDVHKETIAVAVADGDGAREVSIILYLKRRKCARRTVPRSVSIGLEWLID
jgi:hypothetical protein